MDLKQMLDTQHWQIVSLLQVLTVKIDQSAYLNILQSKKTMTKHFDFHTSNDSSPSQKTGRKGRAILKDVVKCLII